MLLARQFYQYGLWKVRVLQKHPRQMSIRHFVPPAFVFFVVGGFFVGPLAPWLPILTLLFYSGVMLAVARSEEKAPGRMLRLWLALVTIHHAWGTGFLMGILRFTHRWFVAEPEPRKLGPTVTGAATAA